jgi:hypothetical protein
MKNKQQHWSKTELKVYILLMCAKADNLEVKGEIDIIKSKVDKETFDRLYKEFSADNEDVRFDKIENVIGKHIYSPSELNQLKKEIHAVFAADHKFQQKELYLKKVFDNILY